MMLKKKKILLTVCAAAVMASTAVTASARGFDIVPSVSGGTCSPAELFTMLQNGSCGHPWHSNFQQPSQNCPDRPSIPEWPELPEIPAPPVTPPEVPQPPVTPPQPEQPSVPEAGTQAYAQEVVRLVNAERATAGLAPLTINTKAQNAAQVRAKEQSVSFSHTRPNGTSCFTALAEAGASYRTAGENIAYGQRTPQQVMTGWMNSAGHRANILSASFTEIGVGYYTDASGTPYWAQMFLS